MAISVRALLKPHGETHLVNISRPLGDYRGLREFAFFSVLSRPSILFLPFFFPSRLVARPSPFPCRLFLSRSHSPTRPRSEKEVINIAAAFRSWPSEGTKLCPRMGGVTPNPQSQNGSLRRPGPCYGGAAEVSSHLLRVRPDRGWLRTILSQSRNVLPNRGEDTLRISVARAHGGPRG